MNDPVLSVEQARGICGTSAANGRRTRLEVAALDTLVIHAVTTNAPVTVRGVFYQVVSLGGVSKTEHSYRAVQRRVLALRRSGRLKYADVADGTRWVIHSTRYGSVHEALMETANLYRRRLWDHSEYRLHLFCEKDAITSIVSGVCTRWDVSLGIARGYSSETFAWNVAESVSDEPDRVHILGQLGDHDPSGVDAWRDFTAKVLAMTTSPDLEFVRLAVTPEQIIEYDLPTRPTKSTDTRAGRWEDGGSVEVDAIPAPELRDIVTDWIETYAASDHELNVLAEVERSEREDIERLAWLR